MRRAGPPGRKPDERRDKVLAGRGADEKAASRGKAPSARPRDAVRKDALPLRAKEALARKAEVSDEAPVRADAGEQEAVNSLNADFEGLYRALYGVDAATAKFPGYQERLAELLRFSRRLAFRPVPTRDGRQRLVDLASKLIDDIVRSLKAAIAGDGGGGGGDRREELERLLGTYATAAQEVMAATLQLLEKGENAFGDLPRRAGSGNVETVIAQAAYMSGDMFGVSAALALKARVGVAIFYDPNTNIDREVHEKTLLPFYDGVPNTDGKAPPHPRVMLIPTADCAAAYRMAVDGQYPDNVFRAGLPTSLDKPCKAIGTATRIVAESMQAYKGDAWLELADKWLPKGWSDGTLKGPVGAETLAEWVRRMFPEGSSASYALLWFRRSGARGGAHRELDTSVSATSDLITALRASTFIKNLRIVIIGDSGHGLSAPEIDVDLTEYWKDQRSPFYNAPTRHNQLALFGYLKKSGFNVLSIGMRSGGMEGPALLGIRTIYMQEVLNFQEGRMEHWEGKVPGYQRVDLGHVPTAAGKLLLEAEIKAAIKKAEQEIHSATARLSTLLGKSAPIIGEVTGPELKEAVYPAESVYRPPLPGTVYRNLDKLLKSKFRDFPKDWTEKQEKAYRSALFGLIRAAEDHAKAILKGELCANYDGPQDGLSETDKKMLEQAISQLLGGWTRG